MDASWCVKQFVQQAQQVRNRGGKRGKSEQTLHVTVFSVTQRGRELNFMADHHATARMKTSTADEMSQFIYPFKEQA